MFVSIRILRPPLCHEIEGIHILCDKTNQIQNRRWWQQLRHCPHGSHQRIWVSLWFFLSSPLKRSFYYFFTSLCVFSILQYLHSMASLQRTVHSLRGRWNSTNKSSLCFYCHFLCLFLLLPQELWYSLTVRVSWNDLKIQPSTRTDQKCLYVLRGPPLQKEKPGTPGSIFEHDGKILT